MSLLPFTQDVAVALARAATDDKPGFVIVAFDDEGVLLAVCLPDDYTPAAVTDGCRLGLGLLSAEGPLVSAVVVAVQPDFGPDEAAGQWPELRRSFEAIDCSLLGWLLVDAEGEVVSVEVGS